MTAVAGSPRRAWIVPLGAALALAAGAGTVRAERPHGTFRVTNDAGRIVECTLLVDGATRTYLKVHPGKAYFDDFTQGRRLQLACMRGKQAIYGPLKLGADYRFVRKDSHIAVVEGPPAAP